MVWKWGCRGNEGRVSEVSEGKLGVEEVGEMIVSIKVVIKDSEGKASRVVGVSRGG